MWRSPSTSESEQGIQYPIEKLDFLINYIGSEIESKEDLNELWDKDGFCDMHSCAFLDKMTNGEYFFCLYEIFLELTSEAPVKELRNYKEAILTELVETAGEIAIDMIFDGDSGASKNQAEDIWSLYEYIRTRQGMPVWMSDEGKAIPAPQFESLSADDWKEVLEEIWDDLFWDRDYLLFSHFSQYEHQPHSPTFAEFRQAIFFFKEAYTQTRWNRKSVTEEANAPVEKRKK